MNTNSLSPKHLDSFFPGFYPNHPTAKQHYQEKLNTISQPKRFQWLMVNKNGELTTTGLFGKICQEIKGLFGKNRTQKEIVDFRLRQCIAYGEEKGYLDTHNTQLIRNLAKKAGLTPNHLNSNMPLVLNFYYNNNDAFNKFRNEDWLNWRPAQGQPQPQQQGSSFQYPIPQSYLPPTEAFPGYVLPQSSQAGAPLQQSIQATNSSQDTQIKPFPLIMPKEAIESVHAHNLWKNFERFRNINGGEPSLDEASLAKVHTFIISHKTKIDEIRQDKSLAMIRTNKFPGQLPYNLMISQDGNIYILPSSKKGFLSLGEGSFKKVTKAIRFEDGKIMALPKVNVNDGNAIATFNKEIDLQRELKDSPHFLEIYSTGVHYIRSRIGKGDQGRIVQEICAGPFLDLIPAKTRDVLQSNGAIVTSTKFTKEELNTDPSYQRSAMTDNLIMFDLLQGLHHMKEKNIFHSDIKPTNLMYNKDSKGAVNGIKFIDFGGAVKLKDNEPIVDLIEMTPYYFAPEATDPNNDKGFHRAGIEYDTWSMGIVIAQFYGVEIPWLLINPQENTFMHQVEVEIEEYARQYNLNIPPFDPKTMPWQRYLVWRMMDPDPKTRIKPEETLDLLRIGVGEKQYADLYQTRYNSQIPENFTSFMARMQVAHPDWLAWYSRTQA